MVRRVAWSALLAGLISLLVVPLVVPVETTGTLTFREAAGPDATFVDIGGLHLHYELTPYRGEDANPPLFLLLHGFGASTYSWREVAPGLSALGAVLSYDRPAFGVSERPTVEGGESPYAVKAQLNLITDLMNEFATEGQPVILMGHSAWGALAAEYALENPGTIESLILVAPAILTTGGGPNWLSVLFEIPQVDRIGPLLVAGIASSGNELLERSYHNVDALSPQAREAYRLPLTIIGWEKAFWEFTKTSPSFEVSQKPEALSVSTAIITGDDDRVVATQDSLELATRIPGAILEVIPQSGHLPQEETPEGFLRAVAKVLATLR